MPFKIERLQEMAFRLFWLKPIAIIFGAGSLAAFSYILLASTGSESKTSLFLSIIGLLWALLLYSFTTLFTQVPSAPQRSEKFFRKLKIRLIRGFFYLLALSFILLTVAAIYLSSKIFSI